ncbi:MAG: protein kinase, partial [Actinomycetota bacterium]|nr:protein kinase [Actinomycetota bacterium]
TDFGISHAVGDVTVTATGILAGTPAFLAPEVARGNPAGFASDVFSLGSTLYTALEGTPPFGLDNNAIALLHQVASGEITPPSQSGALTSLLLRLLQRNPEQRPTMQQAHEALATLAAGLAEPQGGPPAPTVRVPRNDPPVEPVPATRQVTLPWSEPREETTSPAESIRVTPAVGQPAGASDGGRPGRRTILASAMALMLLVVGTLVAILVSNGTVTGNNAAVTPNSDRPAQSLQPLPTPSDPGSPRQVIPPTASADPTISPDPTVSPAPADSPAPTGSPASPAPADPGNPGPGNPQETPEQLQEAITDYYALMPGNLTAGWDRLTADYQQNHAGGFTGYQNFWEPVQRVTVRDVSAREDGAVDATVEYVFNDGRIIQEQTSYRLTAEDGRWKISSSTVRSSQTR